VGRLLAIDPKEMRSVAHKTILVILTRPPRPFRGLLVLSLLVLGIAGPGLAEPTATAEAGSLPHFIDVTEESGIRFRHSFGDEEMSNIIESAGSGCAVLDYNKDGWIDIYTVNCGYLAFLNDGPVDNSHVGVANRLYRNNGDGTFTDVTEAAGCGDTGYGMACVAGDIDNDGDSDLYITNFGRNTLYRNDGKGSFSDITVESGVGDTLAGIGCVFLDYDKDGLLDLYVGNYLEFDPEYRLYYAADEFPGPLSYLGQPDVLYRNDGDGTFTDVTEAAGVLNDGRAMGISAGDYDNDGWTDIIVANDAMENYLYRNNHDGTFTDVALSAGVAFSANGDASSSMGGDFGDFDNDGDLDLVVPDMSFNNLYLNLGNGYFDDVTAAVGLAEASGQFVSWSGDFADFDNDGYLDLLISNGDAHRLDTMETMLLMNVSGPQGTRVFRDFTDRCGPWFRQKSVGRGQAVLDFDNDGDLDFFLLNLDRNSQLVRNDGDNAHHWLLVDLVGTRSNRDGIGSWVVLRAGDLRRIEEKRSATGYLSQNDPRLHFGLGEHEIIDELEIRWPSGAVQKLVTIQADQIMRVEEPAQ
jgi:hypothetical protein